MTTHLVGVLEFTSKYRYGLTSRGIPLYLFKPYDTDRPDYIVGSSERDLRRNQIALVMTETTSQQGIQKPRATLIRLLGPVGDSAAEQAALLHHYCPSAQKELVEPVNSSDDENRQSLDAESGWTTFHIDPPGCRDIDDAIAYNYELRTWAITIADVAAAVPTGSVIDKTAEAIGSTFYSLEGRALRPMLPPSISEGSASLLPDQKRRGLTLFLRPNGAEDFALTWITVQHSFTYDSFVGSAVAFDLQVSKEPHAWIEELMIRYCRAAATLLKKAGSGILRVQPPADADKIKLWTQIDPVLANEAALYEAVTTGEQAHASLGLYCHATSPLRRYADLVNQRVIKGILARETQPIDPTLTDRLNGRMKANKRWSRDLTFLTYVTPGRVHEIEVVWASMPFSGEMQQVWVPLWKRLIRLRHDEQRPLGTKGRIQIFCDPTKRNWKQRILTSSIHAITENSVVL